jgi:hypothetical protein
MKKWLCLFAFTCLTLSCIVQKTKFSWSDYRPVLANYLDHPDSINHAALKLCLLRVMSESMKQKRPVPPGIYLEYAFLLKSEGNNEMAKQYFDLERHFYPDAAKLIDNLESKPE